MDRYRNGTVLLGIVMFAGYVFRVVNKVRFGHGLDRFLTGEGVEFNYIGALILVLLIPLSLIVGWGIRYWQLREEPSFK